MVAADDGKSVPEISESRPKSLTGNALWSLIAAVWSTAVTFFLTPFLIAHIGIEHYGFYVLLISIGGLMGLMDLGLGEATLRYVALYYGRKDLEGINRVFAATLSVYAVTALTAWVTLFLAAPGLVRLLALSPADMLIGVGLLRLTAITFAVGLVGSALASIPQALQRYDIDTKVTIAVNVFEVAGTVGVIWVGWGIHGLVFWGVAVAAVRLLIGGAIAKHLISQIRLIPFPSIRGLKEIFSYGIFSLLRQVSEVFISQTDRVLLGALVSPAAVTYLTVPKNLAFRGNAAIFQAGSVLFPKFSAMTDHTAIARLYLSSTWTILCATLLFFVPVTVLIPDFLRLWINPDFAEQAAWIGQFVAGTCLVRGAFVPYVALFRGIGKPQYLTVLSICSGVASFAANVVLIPAHGLKGAAYSCCVAPAVGFSAIVFAWRGVLGMRSWAPLLRSVLLPITLGYSLLAMSLLIRQHLHPLGWLGLVAFGAVDLIVVGITLFGVEHFVGGERKHTHGLIDVVRGFLANRLPHLATGEEA